MEKANPEKIEEHKETPAERIAELLTKHLETIRNVGVCSSIYVPLSAKIEKANLNKIKRTIDRFHKAVEEEKTSEIIRLYPAFTKAERRLTHRQTFLHPFLLMRSLFLSLFSFYDAFSGDFIKTIYLLKPELLDKIERNISYKDLKKYNSLEDVKDFILDKEIENYRRDSYIDQFKSLEAGFGISTLRQFPNWPKFVECAQRRNIITHCDGVISHQYISICIENGHKSGEKVGTKLSIDGKYLSDSIDLLYEVTLKLGQTLWRKTFPEQIDEADEHLSKEIFEIMTYGRWDLAVSLSEFATTLAKKTASDMNLRIHTINHALSLKRQQKGGDFSGVIKSLDWTPCIEDFKLAVDVLNDDFKSAAKRMIKIDKESEIVRKDSYHDWPLFMEFRKTADFLEAYKKIYKEDFNKNISKTAKEMLLKTTKKTSKKQNLKTKKT